MSAATSPEEVARRWVKKGAEDLAAADILLKAGGPFSAVCFHAQQAAEKYVKALLSARNIHFDKTHDIGELLALLPSGLVVVSQADHEQLSEYAVLPRYPEFMEVDARTALTAVALAKTVAQACAKVLPPKALLP